ncbi:DUF3892 domain-containing protein [Bifidobacterium mongoliense]|uniref:DUF3892 domain-containing protein n=1 Tax=Bifidobacterium mongoliense TaxID=518643 RepID=UPI0030ECE52A
MAITITNVRFNGSVKEESEIIAYRWREIGSGKIGNDNKPDLVNWIKNQKGKAYVGTGSNRVDVGVVEPTHGAPYLRTYADGRWTNNLVNLPIF